MTGAGASGPRGASARLRAIGAFWYDFLVGDDWVLAAAVVAGLAGTWLLSRASAAAWWLLPVVVAAALALSVRRASRR